VVDFDRDGDVDVLMKKASTGVRVLVNTTR